MKPVIRFHTAYLGHTGYAAHARGLIRSFKKYHGDFFDIRVRNCSWSDDFSYLDEIDYSVLEKITIQDNDKKIDVNSNLIIEECKKFDNVNSDIDIVLLDQANIYYYSNYSEESIKIVYLVWESTEIIHEFYNHIKTWDYFFVVSDWHRDVLINHGIEEHKIFIIPEGLDEDILNFKEEKVYDTEFTASFFGRWDYRKSLQEILWSFIEEFPYEKYPNFKINLSCDNPFACDEMNSTEERLIRYGIHDPRINILGFLDRKQYLKIINNSHVFLNCARAEGWNIPLFEAIALSTPVTYCDYGAPKIFTKNCPGEVKFKYLEKASRGFFIKQGPNFPGYYCEPDFDDFKRVIREIYTKKDDLKFLKTIHDLSVQFKNTWTWYNSANTLKKAIESILQETYLIIAHCDSLDKIELLNKCISSINSENFKIASYLDPVEGLHDKWIKVNENKVKFLNDQNSEDLLNFKWPIFSTVINDKIIQDYFYFIHHWSAFNLVKSSIESLSIKGKKRIHVINYDYIVEDISIHRKYFKDYQAIFYKWQSKLDIKNNIDWNMRMINGAFFSGTYDYIYNLFSQIEEKDFYKKYSFYEQAISDLIFSNRKKVKIFDSKKLNSTCREWDIITRRVDIFNLKDAEINYCLFEESGKTYIFLFSDKKVSLIINKKIFYIDAKTELIEEIDLPLTITDINGSKLMYRSSYNGIGKLKRNI